MTNSLSAEAVGVQLPRVRLAPRATRSEAEDAVFLASRYGLVPDEWQELVLGDWLAVKSNGRWACPRCGLAVPRQNGKNGVLEMRELFGMVVLGEKFLHTAHEVKTARKAFLRLAGFFENERQFPELAAMVKEIRRTNGQEAIVLDNGGACEFIARSKGSGRGFTVDVLVMDEAQELSDDSLAALLPTISAAPLGNPQQILTGTPPSAAMNGEVWTRVRTAGLEAVDPRLSWLEWSCEPDADLDDLRSWAQANPSLGGRLGGETLTDERASMDDATFGRERLGMWADPKRDAVIDPDLWAALHDADSRPMDPVAFAVDIAPDRKTASIALAGNRRDGDRHVEIIPNVERGTGWVVDRVVELNDRWKPCAIVLDPAGPAGSLIPELEERGVEVLKMSAQQMAQACGAFYDAATGLKLRHLNDPRLNTALAAARQRPLGDAWAWSRKEATSDITPLVAVTLALHGLAVNAQPKKKRTGVVAGF